MVLAVTDSAGVAQCRVPAEDAGAEGEIHHIPIGDLRPSPHGRDRSRPGVDLAYHFAMQNFEVLSLYRSKLADPSPIGRSIDKWFCLEVTCPAIAVAFPISWIALAANGILLHRTVSIGDDGDAGARSVRLSLGPARRLDPRRRSDARSDLVAADHWCFGKYSVNQWQLGSPPAPRRCGGGCWL
jgi:hypothetical protein